MPFKVRKHSAEVISLQVVEIFILDEQAVTTVQKYDAQTVRVSTKLFAKVEWMKGHGISLLAHRSSYFVLWSV